VTGLRALSILWVLVQHVQQGLRPLQLVPAGAAFLAHPALRLGWAGNLGVDVFFVISGYLIGGMLMREREETGALSFRLFYMRRAMRILPAYFVALAVAMVVGVPNAGWAWANVIFVNNFLPFTKQFMAHTWSLAIEEQFYALFPPFVLLLYAIRPARRTLVVVTTVLAFAALAVFVVLHHGLVLSQRFPDFDDFWRYMDLFYVRPYTRFGALFVGVLVARLERSGALAWLERHALAAGALCVLAAMTAAWVVLVFPEGRDAAGNRTLSGALALATGGYLFASAVGVVLALSRTKSAIGRVVSRVLGARVLHPIARLSYAAYLFHPLCIGPVFGRFGFDLASPGLSYVRLLLASLVPTFAVSTLVHLLIELPFMNIRPRARSTPAA
jgi:peptidoglycan/LPS O-acetylase OafA/YrhL